jgi:V/A-type H+-transporting ATPase subunit D
MAEDVQPTRTELLRLKNQIVLAEQGCELLKKKRDALLVEFMKIMESVVDKTKQLEDMAVSAGYSLAVAKAVDGFITLKSAGLATKGNVEIEISGSHIMGVPVPTVTGKPVRRSTLDRGYGLIGISSRIEETAERFEQYLELIIEIAAVETKFKRLAQELKKTKRRVNALDQVVVPSLKQKLKITEAALDERSREDLFRLKKVKKALEAKKAVQIGAL